ncbi:MAG TPA: DUF3108 domain-containing protein [Gemmatimonadales bacterium]|nr:DUF3108 domain-containing protein [Gemmatimonadales bacterium]
MKRLARSLVRGAGLASVLAAAPAVAAAQDPARDWPFDVGERFTYQVKLGIFSVGRATMGVLGRDTVRGQETFVLRFTLNGKALFFSLDDTLTSWTGVRDFHSYRFLQDNNEDGRERTKDYRIFPDSGYYRVNQRDTTFTTVADPLDDTAFFYWVRTLPLEVGQSYTWDRYFRPDRNPVRIRVLKRQNCELPGDVKRRCLLIQPSIRAKGMLGESSDARILMTDDVERIPVEVRSNFSFGTLVLKLRDVRMADPSTALGHTR